MKRLRFLAALLPLLASLLISTSGAGAVNSNYYVKPTTVAGNPFPNPQSWTITATPTSGSAVTCVLDITDQCGLNLTSGKTYSVTANNGTDTIALTSVQTDSNGNIFGSPSSDLPSGSVLIQPVVQGACTTTSGQLGFASNLLCYGTGSVAANVAALNVANTFTAVQTLTSPVLTTPTVNAGTVNGLTGFAIRDTSAAFDVTLAATSTSGTLTAGRTLTLDVGNVAHTVALGTTANTITFPNAASGTVPLLNLGSTWTAKQIFASGQYTLLDRQVISTGTVTYTITAGTRAILVQCLGGGGAGGGAVTAAVSAALGGGGGGGGYAESFITSLPGSPVTVAVGAGGTPGAVGNNPGGNGADCNFNSGAVIGKGGTGGTGGAAGTVILDGGAGGPGGVPGTGDVTVAGMYGNTGLVLNGTVSTSGGFGGNATGPYGGGGGQQTGAAGGGNLGKANGGGGSGGAVVNGSASVAGGAGAAGIMVITEFN